MLTKYHKGPKKINHFWYDLRSWKKHRGLFENSKQGTISWSKKKQRANKNLNRVVQTVA